LINLIDADLCIVSSDHVSGGNGAGQYAYHQVCLAFRSGSLEQCAIIENSSSVDWHSQRRVGVEKYSGVGGFF
jgi:hypothetical protein